MIRATAWLRKVGQEAGKRRFSVQVEDMSLVDGVQPTSESIHDALKNNIYGTGKWWQLLVNIVCYLAESFSYLLFYKLGE